MKILLVVNIVLPKVANKLGQEQEVLGGWLSGIVDGISKKEDIELAVATPYKTDKVFSEEVDGVRYYFLPKNGLYDIYEDDCKQIIEDFTPDIVHIEGTEYKHANTFIKAWKGKSVISLQGVINAYYQYYDGGLDVKRMLTSFNISKINAAISIILKKRILKKRLKWERETIGLAQNILGRTYWDNAYGRKYNEKAKYYSCNRILREPFYSTKWDINEIEKYSIYVGNSYQPLKGGHFVIEAAKKLKVYYPQLKVYIAGISPYDESVKRNLFKNGYARYLRYLISEYKLEDSVIFMGPINAKEVAKRLKKSHVYCLASAIENSPNTLGEAMLIGVPCISSFVGGVNDMAKDNEEALLYRFDEVDVLVNQIRRVFEDDKIAEKLSENGRKRAEITHKSDENIDKLYKCYKEIMDNSLSIG